MGSSEPLYVGLRTADGTKTLNLTDTTKYYWPKADWVPPVGLPTSDGYADVVETIPLEAIGTTGAAVAANVRALTNLLYQAQRWADGDDVSAVIMDIVMPGSNPAKVLSQVIKGWDGSLFSATYYDQVNTIRRASITLNLTRAGCWYHTSFRYPNLWNETDFGTLPGTAPTTVNAGLTAGTTAMTGFYGGRAYLQWTKTGALAANTYINSLSYSVTAGQTYTMIFSHSHTNITSADIQLVRAGPVGVSGAPVAISLSTAAIDSGTGRFAATFVSSFTGVVYPYFQFAGPSGATFRVAEMALMSGSQLTELWHPTYTELVTGTPLTSWTSPDMGYAQFRWTHKLLSPVALTLARTGGQVDYRHPAGFLMLNDKYPDPNYQIDYETYNGTYAAPFTQVIEADAINGSVCRYTPTGTTVQKSAWATPPSGAFGWKGLINILAGLRNNSVSTSFTVWLEIGDAMGIVISETPKRVIAANATSPTWYRLGIASIARRRTAAKYRWCVQASAASGTIDLNPVFWCRVRPGATVVQLDSLDLGVGNNFTQLLIDHQYLSDRSPNVSAVNSAPAIDSPFSWWTSPVVMMAGNAIYGFMLAMNGAKWKTYLTGGVTVQTWQMNAVRLPAYPTAE